MKHSRIDILDAEKYINTLQRDLTELKVQQAVGASSLVIERNSTANVYDAEMSVPEYYSLFGSVYFEAEKQDNPFGELIIQLYIGGVRQFVGNGNFIMNQVPRKNIVTPQSAGEERNYKVFAWYIKIDNTGGGSKTYQLKFIVPSTDKGTILTDLYVGTLGY